MTTPAARSHPFRGFDGSEIDAAVLVASVIDPTSLPQRVFDEIEALAANGSSALSTPWEDLQLAGFQGDATNYYALDNSCIDRVVARRLGIPITLAVVVIAVARARGMPAAGVGFPGHFLADVDGQLIDPFAMRAIERQDCAAFYQGRLTDALFAHVSPAQIALRMLGNVRGILVQRQELARALDIADHQLDLVAGQSEYECRFTCDKAELWLKLGSPDMARAHFESALATAAGSELQAAIETRLQALQSATDTLH